jgi:hypothetical protein
MLITLQFMETVEWFLGTHLQWFAMNDVVSVHLSRRPGLLLILSKTTIFILARLLLTLRHIAPAFRLMPSLNLTSLMIAQLSSSANANIKALLAQSGGLLKALAPILPPLHSFLLAYCN